MVKPDDCNMEMVYKNINSIVLYYLPNLPDTSPEDIKEEIQSWWLESVKAIEDVPAYCFLETRMGDYMRALIPQNEDVEEIKKLFHFFEKMATCEDINVRDLLQVGFLEQLWATADLLNVVYKYMHPQTKILCDELASSFRDPRACSH